MYIPRLRKITHAMEEIKSIDPKTTLTYEFIRDLVKTGQVTCMKYGNAWLVNLDELYKLLGGKVANTPTNTFRITKRFYTSGDIYRLFKEEDANSIITRPNCRQFCLDNNITMDINRRAWLINLKEFMTALNPKGLKTHYSLPRMRHIKTSVDQWNRQHRRSGQMIDRHMIERFINKKGIKCFPRYRYILNYDQLEKKIAAYIKETGYKKKKIKR